MNFHEYQAKQLFADYGIAVPAGRVARSPEEAVDAAKAIGGDAWMVKAQIHAGGRGKAGGVKYSKSFDEVREYAKGMLGTKMETYQSAGVALPVDSVLVTQATDIAQELYLSVMVDRASQAITFIASADGGVEIEKTAVENPDAVAKVKDLSQGGVKAVIDFVGAPATAQFGLDVMRKGGTLVVVGGWKLALRRRVARS